MFRSFSFAAYFQEFLSPNDITDLVLASTVPLKPMKPKMALHNQEICHSLFNCLWHVWQSNINHTVYCILYTALFPRSVVDAKLSDLPFLLVERQRLAFISSFFLHVCGRTEVAFALAGKAQFWPRRHHLLQEECHSGQSVTCYGTGAYLDQAAVRLWQTCNSSCIQGAKKHFQRPLEDF